ncbi:hypothetical protein HHK36_032902 [Tetracentron sinense]|uniref:Uncharacterized protein n=1 Tax=Tetracentron sinense TaxID=13715 RepID=A0A834Y8C2_TETSI|nr:hypothetical protein HHK36_032902 [Tetracentron sinense]
MMPYKIRSNNEYSEPVGDMGYNLELKRSSRHHQNSRIVKEKILSPQAGQSLKLRDRLKSEKSIGQSQVDLHDDILHNVGLCVPPKSSGNSQKQWFERKATEGDELVKYMSNLPSYLQRVEKGENFQEKALNFGVLDWGRLEKWKDNKKGVPGRSSMCTWPTNNNSSLCSMVGSSSLSSSRIHSGSHSHQRKQSTSLRSHLNSSPKEDHSKGLESSHGNVVDLQDFKTAPKNTSNGQQKLPRADQFFDSDISEINVEKGKRKDSDSKIILEVGTSSSNLKEHEVSFSSKGKMKARDGESKKRTEQLQQMDFDLADQHCPGSQKTIVLLLPKDCSQRKYSGFSQLSESATIDDGRSTKANHLSFSDSFYPEEEVHFAELYSDIPHSCPLPCKDTEDTKSPSDSAHSLPCSNEISTNGSKGKHTEENKSTINNSNSTLNETSDRLDLKTAEAAAGKGRNPSPNRRSSIGMGRSRMTKSFSFKEGSAVPQYSSTYVTAKSGPVRSQDSDSLDNSNKQKSDANSRARSSPLRRLLDPLLKPREGDHAHSADSLQEESTSICRDSKPSERCLESYTVHPVKRNLNFSSCRPTNANDSHQIEKHEVLTMQALLRVLVKNGLPLFTFTIENSSVILGATTKNISASEKDDCSSIYTFYSLRKLKKKSGGWINQGNKGENQDYVSNIVGQMKASDSHCSKLDKNISQEQYMVREFVLFGIQHRHADQETSDFQPSSELAAIFVNFPKDTTASLSKDEQQSNNHMDLSEMRVPEERCSCNSWENLHNGCTAGSQNLFRTTVILPSADHGLPSTGVPPPLIERWKSGGSCDCGGWDVGCKLRILANEEPCSKISGSSKACPTSDCFDLYVQGCFNPSPQGEAQENRPMFSFAPFKNESSSVNFNASISPLQAFSICIAVWNISDLSDASNLFQEKASQESILMENDRIRGPRRVKGEAPARYVPNPPLSPVGRV